MHGVAHATPVRRQLPATVALPTVATSALRRVVPLACGLTLSQMRVGGVRRLYRLRRISSLTSATQPAATAANAAAAPAAFALADTANALAPAANASSTASVPGLVLLRQLRLVCQMCVANKGVLHMLPVQPGQPWDCTVPRMV